MYGRERVCEGGQKGGMSTRRRLGTLVDADGEISFTLEVTDPTGALAHNQAQSSGFPGDPRFFLGPTARKPQFARKFSEGVLWHVA